LKVYKIKNGTLSKENMKMPNIGDDEVLIKMNAVSLNYRDLLVIESTEQWKPPEDRIPVSDGAGEIVQTGWRNSSNRHICS
jgi:NADPH:quinone reductase-like Zn-dependent oxidoreductase